MAVHVPDRLPMGNSPARARAKETLWRLSALAFAHPAPEFFEALASNRFHEAFNASWAQVVGREWSRVETSLDFTSFEAGFIAAFLHGRSGKPVAALLAGDHEELLAGLTRPVFMLNLTAFYKHFGLEAATGDEGRQDEPDHLACMLEFMSVLCHLETQALSGDRDPAPYRRAQRDFLCRYLVPTLDVVTRQLRRNPVPELDPTLSQLLQDIADWSHQQVGELEARVGPFRDPDAPKPAHAASQASAPAAQNLWD
ncbi:MAG: molecular chaperone TorD family protein [Hyphomicrobiaceae bacterium]